MNTQRVIRGAMAGLGLGIATLLLLFALAIVTSLSSESDGGVSGVAAAEYVELSDGGFELSLTSGVGAPLLLVAATVVGAMVALWRNRHQAA